jgi:hypothetical protein
MPTSTKKKARRRITMTPPEAGLVEHYQRVHKTAEVAAVLMQGGADLIASALKAGTMVYLPDGAITEAADPRAAQGRAVGAISMPGRTADGAPIIEPAARPPLAPQAASSPVTAPAATPSAPRRRVPSSASVVGMSQPGSPLRPRRRRRQH